MTRLDRRRLLKLSGAGAIAASSGGLAAILASGRAPAYAKTTALHWLRWSDFVPASDQLLRAQIVPECEKALGIKLNLDTFPYAALQQKVFAELASSSPFYDIMAVDTPWMPALTKKIEPLISYLKNPQLNDIADPSVKDFIPAVFYDSSVYNPKNPSAHFPDSSAQVDVAEIEKQGFEIYGLPLQANVLTMGSFRTAACFGRSVRRPGKGRRKGIFRSIHRTGDPDH